MGCASLILTSLLAGPFEKHSRRSRVADEKNRFGAFAVVTLRSRRPIGDELYFFRASWVEGRRGGARGVEETRG